jgi:hypothetical protein
MAGRIAKRAYTEKIKRNRKCEAFKISKSVVKQSTNKFVVWSHMKDKNKNKKNYNKAPFVST